MAGMEKTQEPKMPLTPKQKFLWALNIKGNVYSGGISKREKARRRAKSKVARRSRRAGR